ncbi:MAG: YfcE family phosphodiesterase [Ignavibacteria bacterium]|nr:YfcE family phosphodiesterase [Ignavibacteria bacterium]
MRILAFSDVHGSYDKTYAIIEKERLFDVVLIAGDLTTYGTPDEAEEAIIRLKKYGKPVVLVAGNMDPPTLESTFEKFHVSINGRAKTIDFVAFFGVSGSPVTPMRTPYEISEEEIMARAQRGWEQAGAATTKVFVPHVPPRNTKVDKALMGIHVGSTAVRTFVEEYKPDVVVCGHIHEARGQHEIGRTLIVNCGPVAKGNYAVIDIGKKITVTSKG